MLLCPLVWFVEPCVVLMCTTTHFNVAFSPLSPTKFDWCSMCLELRTIKRICSISCTMRLDYVGVISKCKSKFLHLCISYQQYRYDSSYRTMTIHFLISACTYDIYFEIELL